jgi:hypothetical protein
VHFQLMEGRRPNILLGVTGSVATVKFADLATQVCDHLHVCNSGGVKLSPHVPMATVCVGARGLSRPGPVGVTVCVFLFCVNATVCACLCECVLGMGPPHA